MLEFLNAWFSNVIAIMMLIDIEWYTVSLNINKAGLFTTRIYNELLLISALQLDHIYIS